MMMSEKNIIITNITVVTLEPHSENAKNRLKVLVFRRKVSLTSRLDY